MTSKPISVQSQWVGSYRRRMAVSLERMYENALDWAHLPHLHSDAFAEIDLIDAGPWGWRATLTPALANGRSETNSYTLQLTLDRAHRRWISSTLDGPNVGSEIWTHVFEFGERDIEIQADFFVPLIQEDHKDRVGHAYRKLYKQLYDEDEGRMLGRQAALDAQTLARQADPVAVDLGSVAEIAQRLPHDFDWAGRPWRLGMEDDRWYAYTLLCPHMLGSLKHAAAVENVVTCPWHGYQFDVRSGECLNQPSCRLADPPSIEVIDGRVIAQG